MRRRILGIFLILVLMLCGCGGTEGTTAALGEVQSSEETAAAAPETTMEAETTAVVPVTTETPSTSAPETTAWETLPEYNGAGKKLVDNRDQEDQRPAYSYVFDPHVYSELDLRVYGETAIRDFCAYCDAVLAGEDSFPCSGEKSRIAVYELQRRLFPLGIFVTADPEMQDRETQDQPEGRCSLTYLIPKEELLQKAEEFRQLLAQLIAEADLREGDTDLEKALKLYTMLSLRTLYDYAALEDETEVSLSAYRTLTTGWGICQEIAPAYAYLLLQVGIDANTCGGLAKDSSFAHEWTLVRIGGIYYHADVTYQLNEPYSLQYFLTTDEERDEQNMDVPYFNIGDSNQLWHKDLPVTDETYQPLWKAVWYRIDHAAGRIWYLPNWELKGELTKVPSPEKLMDFLY